MSEGQAGDWQRRLEEKEAELERRFRSVDDRIDATLGNDRASVSASGVMAPTSVAAPMPEWNAVTRQWAGLFVEDPTAFFVGTDSELNQLCAYVFNAPHVTGNRWWKGCCYGNWRGVGPSIWAAATWPRHIHFPGNGSWISFAPTRRLRRDWD